MASHPGNGQNQSKTHGSSRTNLGAGLVLDASAEYCTTTSTGREESALVRAHAAIDQMRQCAAVTTEAHNCSCATIYSVHLVVPQQHNTVERHSHVARFLVQRIYIARFVIGWYPASDYSIDHDESQMSSHPVNR